MARLAAPVNLPEPPQPSGHRSFVGRAVRTKTFAPVEVICHFCQQTIKDSPYRSPIKDVPGGRWTVCGPLCPDKPSDAVVFTDWRTE